MASNFRHQKIVLVTDVHVMGQLGVVRSLGEAGYRIYAMSHKKDALGFFSSFVEKNLICPAYKDSEYCSWFETLLESTPVDVIIPSEGFLWAVQSIFEQLSHLLPINSDKVFIYTFINKFDYFDKLLGADKIVSENYPQILFVSKDRIPTDEQLNSLAFPVFIKIDGVYSFEGNDDQIIKIETPSELPDTVKTLQARHEKFLIQGYVPGQKAAVNLFLREGKVQASYVMKAHHETPHKGGVASLRETWANDKMLKDAVLKAEHLGWNGALMMEYRWNRETDRFYLIEINLRFWGYLHLCLYAGINFPLLLVDDFLGHEQGKQLAAPKSVLVRNLSFEVGYLMSYLKDPDVSKANKMGALVLFLRDGLSPSIASDTFYPGDRKVWFYELFQLLKTLSRRS